MENTSLRKLELEQISLEYHLERKDVKNINLRIRKDRSVYLSANPSVPVSEIEAFLKSKETYIVEAIAKFQELEHFKPAPKQYISGETFYVQGRGLRLIVSAAEKDVVRSDGVYIYLDTKDPEDFQKKQRLMTRYFDKLCMEIFSEILNRYYPPFTKYGVALPKLRIREMDTRWGSCLAKKGIVTLNKCLVEAPRNCIEYVVIHELCHFVHPNHSKRFYEFLSMMMPDWKIRKQLLDKSAEYWI